MLSTLIVWVAVTCAGSQMANGQERIDQLRGVYLYNFGNYITWPADAALVKPSSAGPFVIGIVGKQNPVYDVLQAVGEKKHIAGRPIKPVMVTRVEDAQNCHILYFPPETTPEAIRSFQNAIGDKPVLQVGEREGFAVSENGGMINFLLAGTSLKFEINPETIADAHMKASSKLIQLGTVVSR